MVSDIDAQVKQGVDLEVQKAKTALQAEASMLAVDLAEKSIKEKIGPQDHERIVKEYITKVGGRG
jgi:F0F1-type ATP synthase membrane subunit b/b'